MPAKGKELRAHVKPEIHSWIMAAAKARRTSPATIINELVQVQLGVMPRLADILPVMERAQRDGDMAGALLEYFMDTMQQRDDALARLADRRTEIEARMDAAITRIDMVENHLDTAFKWLANGR